MATPPFDIVELYEKAVIYRRQGDIYNAVKLFKNVIKKAPEWVQPYWQLSQIYKSRREWKPTLYYTKKALALDIGKPEGWWALGMAAMALKKWRIARNVWNKFGIDLKKHTPKPICLRIQYNGQFEIIWARTQGPAQAEIRSIPHPGSGFAFRDIVLYDKEISGYNIVAKRRVPIYDEYGLFKKNYFHSYSCIISTADKEDINLLEQLCQDAGLGFEVWSNASRIFNTQKAGDIPEYYDPSILPSTETSSLHIAIAARNIYEAREVLTNWQVICLGSYSDLEQHL
ncbi:MAG: hypothetical protein DHS20C18_00880 [Saprospiraceae bacterium]|nr:MAG: hypothetical protein DHS20C18_00880 [Saprospiraceae bacterium]